MNERKRALEVFADIVRRGSYANLRLNRDARDGENDRFTRALVYTALEKLLRIDGILSVYAGKKTDERVMDILRLGICELLYMETPAHAVVNGYVSLAKESGRARQAGFVNAVLRRVDRERDALPSLPSGEWEALSVENGYPLWIVERWRREYGDETARALVTSEPLPMCVRAQYPLKKEELLSLLPCTCAEGTLDPECLKLSRGIDIESFAPFQKGECTVQGEGAMLACRALGDCGGRDVLDACAAPGGKSAYIASLSGNTARITAWELHAHRTELMKKSFARLNTAIYAETRDAAVFDARYAHRFDRVLTDVPCSGLGLLAGKPDLRYGKAEADIEALAAAQREILDCCCRYVKPGGILVYSTCTVSREENDGQVAAFLKRHPDFVPDPLPFADAAMIQLLPHVHGTEGFFIARMKYVPDGTDTI